ncbi:hypothetical protein MRX96_045518 [Rhipicephalus microplus]
MCEFISIIINICVWLEAREARAAGLLRKAPLGSPLRSCLTSEFVPLSQGRGSSPVQLHRGATWRRDVEQHLEAGP